MSRNENQTSEFMPFPEKRPVVRAVEASMSIPRTPTDLRRKEVEDMKERQAQYRQERMATGTLPDHLLQGNSYGSTKRPEGWTSSASGPDNEVPVAAVRATQQVAMQEMDPFDLPRDSEIPTQPQTAQPVDNIQGNGVTPPPPGLNPQQVREHYDQEMRRLREGNAPVAPRAQRQIGDKEELVHPGNGALKGRPAVALPVDRTPVEAVTPVTMPAHVQAPVEEELPFTAETEGVSVELPSGFSFYSFKDLYVHPIRGKHLSKLARATVERSLLITAEVVSSCLTTSNPLWSGRALAQYLTIPDFYWVMYFMRQNNYSNTSFTFRTECDNHVHVKKVIDGELSAETLRIEEVITKSRLVSRPLQQLAARDTLGLKLRPALVADLIQIMEHPKFGKDEEFDWAAKYASYIGSPAQTLDERIDMVLDLTPDQVSMLEQWDTDVNDYGVDERVTVTCKECGASREATVSIDASTFLPPY